MNQTIIPTVQHLEGHRLQPGMTVFIRGQWVTLTRKLDKAGWGRLAWCVAGQPLPLTTDNYTVYAVDSAEVQS